MLTVQYGFRFLLEEIMSFSDLMLFALSSNQELAQRVSREMGLPLGKSTVRQFLMEKFRLILKNQPLGKMFIFCNPLARRLTII